MKRSIYYLGCALLLALLPYKSSAQLTAEQEQAYYKWWEERGKQFGVAKQVFDQMLQDESLVKKDLAAMGDALKTIDILHKFAQAKDGEAVQAIIIFATEKYLTEKMPGFSAWLGWIGWYKNALELLDKYYVTPARMQTQIDRYIAAREMGDNPMDAQSMMGDMGQLLLETKRAWIEEEGLNPKLINDENGKLHSAWQRRYERYYNDYFENHYQKKLELDRLKKQAELDHERMLSQFENGMRRLMQDYADDNDNEDEDNTEDEAGDTRKKPTAEEDREKGKAEDDRDTEDEDGKGNTDDNTEPVTEEEQPQAISLVISPPKVTLDINESVTFSVYVVYSDGSTEDVTGRVYDDPQYFPDKEGTHTVVAEYQGLSASSTVTVTGCADPHAEYKEGSCKCKDGYTKDQQGNCARKEDVFSAITLLPKKAETHIGGSVTLTVIGVNGNGEAVDITGRVYDDPVFEANEAGTFTVAAEYQGNSSSAVMTVKECADPNAEFDYGTGDCKCKKGYDPGDDGKCQKQEAKYTSLTITPSDVELEIGQSVRFKATAYDETTGENVDVTNEALSQKEFRAEREGEYSVTASLDGLSAKATVTVKEESCPDVNMEKDAEGNCACKDGFKPDGEGGCEKKDTDEEDDEEEDEEEEEEDEDKDSPCADPNKERNAEGDCKCKRGFFPDPDNPSRCKSLEETKDEVKEETDDKDCVTFASIKGKLDALKGQLYSAISNFNAHYGRFQKELNDNKSDPCKNQMLAYSYARAKRAAEMVDQIKNNALAEYATLFLFTDKCPDFDANMASSGYGKAEIENASNQISLVSADMGDLANRIDEEGCDEDDLDELGQQVATDPDADPELTSDGGTGAEIQGDGKDNDGEGQQDEIPVSWIPGYNVTIVVYDSGSAKDDVFSLTVTDVGYQGLTPEGGLKSYPLNLPAKSYTATVTVVSAPDNVGTFTINILHNGVSIGSMTGDPGQGSSQVLNFTIPN